MTKTPWSISDISQPIAMHMKHKKPSVFYALNRHEHTASVIEGFRDWEVLQGAFRCGLIMPDGKQATGIGRCHSLKQFKARAEFGEWAVI